MSEPIWSPCKRRIASTAMSRFMAAHDTYDSLWRWSIEKPEEFWPSVWRFCGVKASRAWDEVLEPDPGVRKARWFPGAQLNFAENLLRHRDDEPAIVAWDEGGFRRRLTHRQLYEQVSVAAQALFASGVRPGDRVAAWLPNIPEAIVGMLATASLGAIWSSCSPDFGVEAVVDRFGQIEPKVLIAADGARYNGKSVETLARLEEIARRLPSLKLVVVVTLDQPRPDLSNIPRAIRWQDELAFYRPRDIVFEQLPFEHPLYILYSSGTTGMPKCLLHGAGGTLLQHLKELVLHSDVRPMDRVFYHTTTGWMMWNWMVSTLATGAALVLYDGSPIHPRKDILWNMAQAESLTHFGTSAKYLALIEKMGLSPRTTHRLDGLRAILSTGSPLPPSSFDYVYEKISPDVQLASISGGTDIISCFALGNPAGPVYRGELQVRGLGMNVEVFDERGEPIEGERGELVCHPPFPSMPLKFWNDDSGERYESSYFRRYPGVWNHGDWAEITSNGGVVILGRSDTTLNPGGVRIGTAEIYRQVEHVEEVLESLAVGHESSADVEIVLFVVLRPGVALTHDLAAKIKQQIRQGASPHHVPKRMFQVSDLPRTVSGKLSEVAVREVIHGRSAVNAGALANPECLSQFAGLKL